MGSYSSYELVAWNDDGSSALLIHSGSSSGDAGASQSYILAGAGDKKTLDFELTNTRDPDTAHEKITAAACTKAADALEKALAAHHYKGVALHKDRCSTAKRDVVAIDAATAQAAELSWVATPGVRPPSAREDAAWKLARLEKHDGATDVAATSGKLVLVMWGESGDSSAPKYGVAYAGGKRLFEL